jgi:excisionase family DNA binding protein
VTRATLAAFASLRPVRTSRGDSGDDPVRAVPGERPLLLTVDEVAGLLRTSRKAIYAMAERGQLPGVTRIGRRLLFRTDTLVDWLRQKSATSLER